MNNVNETIEKIGKIEDDAINEYIDKYQEEPYVSSILEMAKEYTNRPMISERLLDNARTRAKDLFDFCSKYALVLGYCSRSDNSIMDKNNLFEQFEKANAELCKKYEISFYEFLSFIKVNI